MSIVTSKKEFFHLSRQRRMGNTIRQWTPEEFKRSGPLESANDLGGREGSGTLFRHSDRLFAVRSTKINDQTLQGNDLELWQVEWRINIAKKEGTAIFIDEQAPDARSVLKGELMQDTYGWYLYYDRTPGLRMRQAMNWRGKPEHVIPPRPSGMSHARGLEAKTIVRQFMDQKGSDTLSELQDKFPDSIIEFSCYDRPVLGYDSSNTIFWEVRNY